MATKSVFLLDFDNIFLGIWEQDRDLAMRFGREPMRWLPRLSDSYLVDAPRRWLITRCYLNPAGWVGSSHDPKERVYFSSFRPALVSAGFEVVDCPAMTRTGKNAADIRMVIDALDLLYSRGGFEEFVLASGDSDFTPLLQRIRADDRRITIVSPGQMSLAYSSLADRLVDLDAIDALVRPAIPPISVAPAAIDAARPAAWEAFSAFIRTRYAEAAGPLNLAALSQDAARAVPGAIEGDWFGLGFAGALGQLALANVRRSQHFLWDEERHQPPEVGQPQWAEGMPETVVELTRLLDIPRLRRDHWPQIFAALARYAAEHEFNLTESTRWTRDALAESGVQVGRPAIGYVVRATQLGGVPLNAVPPPDAGAIGAAVCANLVERARLAGADLDGAGEALLAVWLGLPRAGCGEVDASN